QAYRAGIFPMAEDAAQDDLFWLDPDPRGILPLDQFHISRSLARVIKRRPLKFVVNRDFQSTVIACTDRDETWINAPLMDLYLGLHDLGHAHAFEIWDTDQCLGGVFGINVGAAFCGESMYSSAPNGSKLALAFLVTHLARQGFTLFDTQFLTDHLARLGGVEISKDAYHMALDQALLTTPDPTLGPLPTCQDVLHRKTQTS
ncbi:MAG: leucyl/phenylalanyl-tRNA--protein transferase, partial [Pseudomonadota bacterium]